MAFDVGGDEGGLGEVGYSCIDAVINAKVVLVSKRNGLVDDGVGKADVGKVGLVDVREEALGLTDREVFFLEEDVGDFGFEKGGGDEAEVAVGRGN